MLSSPNFARPQAYCHTLVSHTYQLSPVSPRYRALVAWKVYGYLASFVAGNFFSASVSSNLSLIEAFGTYSAAFLMRPLGGLYFGRIGDSEGRHSALVQSTALMAVPSLLMGILPTYDRIGATATWAVVACRMAQGFALGGQLTGSYVLMVEAAPPNRRGFYGSLVSAAASVGAALASGVSVAAHAPPEVRPRLWKG